MQYIKIENVNLTPVDQQGLLARVDQLPDAANKSLVKELCRPKAHPVVTLTAQQFLNMLDRPDYVVMK